MSQLALSLVRNAAQMAEAFSSGAAGGGGAGASDTQPPAVPGSGAAGGGGASSSGAQAVPERPLVQCTSGKCSDPPVIEDQQ